MSRESVRLDRAKAARRHMRSFERLVWAYRICAALTLAFALADGRDTDWPMTVAVIVAMVAASEALRRLARREQRWAMHYEDEAALYRKMEGRR